LWGHSQKRKKGISEKGRKELRHKLIKLKWKKN
jgi:hypothetical protein